MTTVSEYIVQRLARLGITECFGVPGDFAFPLNDAIVKNDSIKWIGAANELNAAYAADGYARIKGAALLCTTYAVGELSALNGVMGAKAEQVTLFHLVGMPPMQHQLLHKKVHHTLGDGVFQNFINISTQACCAYAIITQYNCIEEMERVIATALTHHQPAYILVTKDVAELPIKGEVKAWPEASSDEKNHKNAVSLIQDLLNTAKSPMVIPGYKVARCALQSGLQKFIEKSGLPFATMFTDKAVLPETHPNFVGFYLGESSKPAVRQVIESADIIINFGNAIFNDFNTEGFDINISADKIITIDFDYVRFKDKICYPVIMKDILKSLLETDIKPRKSNRVVIESLSSAGKETDDITSMTLYTRLQNFFKANDLIVAETGSVSAGLADVLLPEGTIFLSQAQWGSIGWATPAALGAALADRNRRMVLITGEGSHQLTANEMGNFERYGLKPIIFVLNNSGYMVERALDENPLLSYNDLAAWEYHKLPEALGCKNWFTAKVTTLGELDAAMQAANKGDKACYVEIIGKPQDYPPRLALMHKRLKQMYGG